MIDNNITNDNYHFIQVCINHCAKTSLHVAPSFLYYTRVVQLLFLYTEMLNHLLYG